MIITSMDNFQHTCRLAFVDAYNHSKFIHCGPADIRTIDISDTFIVWACNIRQNYKCIVTTKAEDNAMYAQYTYDGDRERLYQDLYV